MSRPLQHKLAESIRTVSDVLEGEAVSMPYKTAVEICNELRFAATAIEELERFVDLANKAFDAMEGLLANWPETDVATKNVPLPHRPVLTRDKAIEAAVATVTAYRDIEGNFT